MTRRVLLVVTSARAPQDDTLARALARGLSRLGPTRVVSVAPRAWDAGDEGFAPRSPAAPSALAAGEEARVAAATDAEAVRALARGRLEGAAPWIVVSRDASRLDADALELAHGAAAVWTLAGRGRLPRELRARAAAPISGRDFGRPERLLRRLESLPRRAEAPGLPLTSLVVPVHGALPLLRECVDSLRRCTTPPHETILVDNGSDAATRRYLRSLAGVRLIENARNLGFAKAVNQGMRAARGAYVAWVNSDTRVTPGWLERLGDALRSDPGLGAVGPVTNRIAGPALVGVPAGFTPTRRAIDALGTAYALKNAGQRQEVHRLTGFFLLLRRAAAEAIGPLDERFGLGCYEDYDYCLRLRQAGYRLAVARDVFVYHSYHGSFASDGGHREQLLKNRAIFVDKWCARALDFLDHLDPTTASP